MPLRAFSDQQNQQSQSQQLKQSQHSPKDDFFESLQGFEGAPGEAPGETPGESPSEPSGEGRPAGRGRGRGRGRGGLGRGGRPNFGAPVGANGNIPGNIPGIQWRIQQQIQNQATIPFQEGAREAGTVKWFDAAKGFGFIYRQPSNDQVFVHFTSIAGTGFRSLEEGQQVDFIVAGSQRGPVAQDVRVKL